MSSAPKTSFLLADDYFYEPLDRYPPVLEDYDTLVRRHLPADWMIVRQGVWFNAVPQNKSMPAQGFKIHVSATYRSAPEILERIVPILVADRISFKYGLDRRILAIMTGKNWARGGSGKFVTIYPDSEAHFVDLIERLHQITTGLEGPYILSDRRYKDSRILHYRYGGLAPVKEMTAKGEPRYTLVNPEGGIVEDERQPYFVLPAWVRDPFEDALPAEDESEPGTLKNGRYLITSALAFSNSGGVYLATDRESGETVVIKEARPLVNITPSGDDAVGLLEKEYRLLKKVEGANIAPRPYDFFRDWEHSYLVEEYLGDVPSLRFYAASHGAENLVLATAPTREQVESFWVEFKKVFVRIAELLEKLHEYGIVFMDVSMNNILVLSDDLELKLIDFEGAFEPEVEKAPFIFTPGFISSADLKSQTYHFSSDYYGFGALMMSYLMPINGMMAYDSKAPLRFLQTICSDFGLPPELAGVIGGLMAAEPKARMRPAQAAAILRDLEITGSPRFTPVEDLEGACREVIAGTLRSLERVRTLDRADRLFPSDPKMFATNPLGLGYGATGVAYAIKKLSGEVPQEVLDWINQREITAEAYPPGLVIGMAGVAWAMRDIGLETRAAKVLRFSESHPQLNSSADMFYGLAGWGLTQLKFHHETGEAHYLAQAVRAGESLLATAVEEEGKLYWPDGQEGEPLGFAHGSSGVSLFLLYLHLATDDPRYLEAGRRALEFDLAAADHNAEGALTWRLRRLPGSTMLPYLRYGSAGVGLALVRYLWLTGEPRYFDLLQEMFPDLDRKYAIFPGRFVGLAGIGELLIDLARTPGFEERAETALRKLISGVLLFRVDSVHGLCFPGYELFRLATDLGTGSAGIALFLERFLSRRHPDFLLDELFRSPPAAVDAGARAGSEQPAEVLA